MIYDNLRNEELYINEVEYNKFLIDTGIELQQHMTKFINSHYQLLVFLGKDRYVDTIVSEINKYCNKEKIQ